KSLVEWTLRRRGLKQLREVIDIASARVADHEIAQPALAPCFHVERLALRREGILVETGWQRSLLEHKHRNAVLSEFVNHLRARGLVKVGHSASEQRELRVLQLRQIEREGDLPLKPWLHGVPVGGD